MEEYLVNDMNKLIKKVVIEWGIESIIGGFAVIGFVLIVLTINFAIPLFPMHLNMDWTAISLTTFAVFASMLWVLWRFKHRRIFNKLRNMYCNENPPLTYEEGLRRLNE